MTPAELKTWLAALVADELRLSVMIWGPPGVGKSSIVAQVAEGAGIEVIDLRLSQLAPTDLRGLPVPADGIAHWYPPEFLPRAGRGVLLLDELNMAPPAVQGIAQQLILDRRVGAYEVPEGWFIWAAGNRKEDRAAVFDMPAPLANRFIHLEVSPDLDSFQRYAAQVGLHPQIVAFVAFRPALLHALDPHRPAWPSPRAWAMASDLRHAGLNIAPAVGAGAGAEFDAFVQVYQDLPDPAAILAGQGEDIRFPEEPSRRYAITVGLGMRASKAKEALAAFTWIEARAPAEWVQLYVAHMVERLAASGQQGQLVLMAQQTPALMEYVRAAHGMMQG